MLLLQGLQGLQMLKVVRPGACALSALSEPTAARHTRPSTCQPKIVPPGGAGLNHPSRTPSECRRQASTRNCLLGKKVSRQTVDSSVGSRHPAMMCEQDTMCHLGCEHATLVHGAKSWLLACRDHAETITEPQSIQYHPIRTLGTCVRSTCMHRQTVCLNLNDRGGATEPASAPPKVFPDRFGVIGLQFASLTETCDSYRGVGHLVQW